jgi:3-oxoacyl-[acyl-carrier-protein] synthase-3
MAEVGTGILGFGECLPERVIGNDFWGAGFNPSEERLRERNILALDEAQERHPVPPEIAQAMARFEGDLWRGVRKRHFLEEDAEPSDMEAAACRRAMKAAGVAPPEIDLVMVSSLVQDRLYPTNGPALQAKCGLVNAAAWGVELGCASFQEQLLAAHALIVSGTYHKILLVQSSGASRTIDFSQAISTVFGDGAAAVVVGAVPAGFGLIGHYSRTDGSLREGIVNAPIVDGKPHKRWDQAAGLIRLASFDAAAGRRAGMRAPEFCRAACKGAMQQAGCEIADIALFVCNQSTAWFVDACRRSLGLASERIVDTFEEVANIGAAAIPFNLHRAWSQGRLKAGELVLMYSPGAGFTYTATVYRWLPPGKD